MALILNDRPQFWIVGTPLDDEGELNLAAKGVLSRSKLVIAESKKNAYRLIRQANEDRNLPVFFLDNFTESVLQEIENALKDLAKTNGTVSLMSDTGMPMLFDPGIEVLNIAKKLKFQIRSAPDATSWGSACALSGFSPPFQVVGFLNRDNELKHKELMHLKSLKGNIVLMDTPYRFEALLKLCSDVLGASAQAFIAWEISKPNEQLLWGTLGELMQQSKTLSLKKGEFVLILKSLR